jgi:hypothetical protein
MRRDWARWLRGNGFAFMRTLALRALAVPRRFQRIDHWVGPNVDLLLDCHTVRRHLSDALDDQLPSRQAALVRAHLATCAVCPRVDAEMRETVELLGSLREEG